MEPRGVSPSDDKDTLPLPLLHQDSQNHEELTFSSECKMRNDLAPMTATSSPRQTPNKKSTSYKTKLSINKSIIAKPVAKNDINAKMDIIHRIEKLWGKGFIKAYIPKCHRPLIKRTGGTKRTVYRTHEINPKNWLPSVLKAILMVAEQTSDKMALKRAMNEVVRYRIKHTGNHKPQLVTTDFDVIEDMIVRGWTCKASFEIRYKHLLMAQTSPVPVTNEEIDSIMWAGEDDKDDVENEEENPSTMLKNQGIDDVEEEQRDEQTSSPVYIQKGPRYQSMIIEKKKPPHRSDAKQQDAVQSPEQSDSKPGIINFPHQQHMYGGYGPLTSKYASSLGYRPHSYGYPPYNYSPYGSYPPYGYNAPYHGNDTRGRHSSMMPFHPPHPNIPPPPFVGFDPINRIKNSHSDFHCQRERFSPFGKRKRVCEDDFGSPTQELPIHSIEHPPARNIKIKRETGEENDPIDLEALDFEQNNCISQPLYEPSNVKVDNRSNGLGGMSPVGGSEEDEELLRLELDAAEARAKVLTLRAKMAAAKRRRQSGNSQAHSFSH